MKMDMPKCDEIILLLPKEILPDCWNDHARMNALYAPLRNKTVNSQDWDSKYVFWKGLINKWCAYTKNASFTLDDLNKVFTRDGRPPGSLQMVLEEMNRQGNVQNISRFLETPQETWTGWAVDLLVKKPFYWSYNKMKERIVSPTDVNTVFVDLDVMKSQCKLLLGAINYDDFNRILDIKQLKGMLGHQTINNKNLNLYLHYLRCQGRLSLKENFKVEGDLEEEPTTLLKFARPNEKLDPINDVDTSIYALEKSEKALTKAVEKLEKDKGVLIDEAKTYLKKGMRQMAKNSLRKKHALENYIDKRASVLENVQVLLARVKEAECDSKVVESYRKGVSALKNTFKEGQLSEDNVNDVISDVQEVLDMHDDIQFTLGQSVSAGLDADLEEELAELLASSDENHAGSNDQPSINLPSPPKEPTLEDEHADIERRLRALHTNLSPTQAM